ncbi:MAG TPA: bifunctional serine/threonine-protein kinase/formylglycine-generating enzyme family protein [Bryobacteraceae bacterium]|jgi:tRNA A-37 threonylcarbamoyl transferase component Bud32|nr:bifunctional serine/threonine-protein kinase/formylglycine-generating enzyme family protein [Bryobacteraceae bacterium]
MRRIGQYQVFEEIGRGAAGVVYRALDPAIGRQVAIKELRLSQLAPDEVAEARHRFIREAQAVGNLRHENIVTLYQFIEENDSLYLVMELLPGGSLSRLMKAGTLTTDAALDVIGQIASALDRAHANGIVHRDIKPGNILVSSESHKNAPLVKVTDFGIARLSTHPMTLDGTSLGTPAYMAPEQIQGLRVDAKADQFSLAILAYELLAHRPPFSAASHQSLMYQIVNADPAPLVEVPNIDPVIRRALAKDPGQRFPTCGDFAEALQPLDFPTIKTVAPKRRSLKPIVFGLGALAVAALAAGLYLTRPGPVESPVAAPAVPVVVPPKAALPVPEAAKAPDIEANPKDGLNYVLVPATPPFRIGQTEVTQEAYRTITGKSPSHFKGAKFPVENVKWNEAQKYCKAIGGRLPTEKEWEYAAQSQSDPLDGTAWYSENSAASTHPVARKTPNSFGLYDMLGNVWEWTTDDYDNNAKVARGGAWDSQSETVRPAFRGRIKPNDKASNLGFRCIEYLER